MVTNVKMLFKLCIRYRHINIYLYISQVIFRKEIPVAL